MHDVGCQVMLTVGNIDFLTAQEIVSVVVCWYGACPDRTEIRPSLWLSQIHCSGPLTRYEFGQIDSFLFLATLQ